MGDGKGGEKTRESEDMRGNYGTEIDLNVFILWYLKHERVCVCA